MGEKKWIKSLLRPLSWIRTHRVKLAVCTGAIVLSSAITFAGHQYVKANTKLVYTVYVDSQEVGLVEDKQIVEQLMQDKFHRAEQQHPQVHMVMETSHIHYEIDKQFKPIIDEETVLTAVDAALQPQAYGVQLIVNDQVVGTLKDKDTANYILDRIRNKYTKPLARKSADNQVQILSSSTQGKKPLKSEVESVQFKQKVALKTVEISPNDVDDPSQLIDSLLTGDVKDTTYTVQKGDCIGCIADKLGISKQVIYDNNRWIVDDAIFIGDVLDVTVLDPTLSVVTQELVEELHPIKYATVYEQDDQLKKGHTRVVQEGVDGEKLITIRLTSVNGILSHEQLINEEIIQPSQPAIIKRGTKVIPGEGTGSFAWPVSQARVTSGYGKRWGSLHKGIDLISSNRTIKAADNGKVTFAGVKSGYGNAIIVDHNNGYTTLYAHLKTINVKSGTTVEKGESIGVMGSTGHSTGVHLHFEILKKGVAQNPINYLNQ